MKLSEEERNVAAKLALRHAVKGIYNSTWFLFEPVALKWERGEVHSPIDSIGRPMIEHTWLKILEDADAVRELEKNMEELKNDVKEVLDAWARKNGYEPNAEGS